MKHSRTANSSFYAEMLAGIKNRVEKVAEVFRSGHGVLVGDDGIRENEIDFVFHAEHASTELVNLAIQEARGLVCVALGDSVTDRLNLPLAPQYPSNISHTAFTLSVDSRHGITSGISARDRATTIRLLGNPFSTGRDFVTPGHVFPLRARKNGLLERTGHTEAAIELCRIVGISEAAVIAEVLDKSGEPVRPQKLRVSDSVFREYPFITTSDLLWYQIFFNRLWDRKTASEEISNGLKFFFDAENELSSRCWWQGQKNISTIAPELLSICISNGMETRNNQVSSNKDGTLFVVDSDETFQPVSSHLESLCDLSRKEGLHGGQPAIRRFITLIKVLSYISPPDATVGWFSKIQFPIPEDKELMLEILRLKKAIED